MRDITERPTTHGPTPHGPAELNPTDPSPTDPSPTAHGPTAQAPTPPALRSSSAARSSPPPPTPDAVAATIADLLSQGPTDGFAFELALTDLVHAAREDRSALRAALTPVVDKGLAPQLGLGRGQGRDLPLATPLRQLHALAVNAAWLPAPSRLHGRASGYAGFELARLFHRLALNLDRPPGMDPYALRTPADILTLRLAELAAHIGDAGPVEPVSTPTDPDGWIDPDVLAARIAAAESDGWQPWPLDFDQALLRLPDSPAPMAARAAHRLASPAGRRLAGWLRDGRPTLPSSADLVAEDTSAAYARTRISPPRAQPLITLPETLVSGSADDRYSSRSTGPLAPSTLIHLLRRGWYPPRPLADGSCWTVCWSALLPGRPDLIAIAAAWHPRHPDAHGGSCPTPVLTRLAHAAQAQDSDPDQGRDGSDTDRHIDGHGTLAAIARALTSRSPAKRADAAQSLAILATSGRFDAHRFGTALAAFATRTDRQFLRTAVPALQYVLRAAADAHDSHDSDEGTTSALAAAMDRAVASAIGTAILGWLPAILPPAVNQPEPYTSHLLNLAADALTSARASRQPTPVLDALTMLASRPSHSSVSDAAQRLLAALTRA